MNRIVGRFVLVTGGSSGIGEGCARLFTERGADLVLCARREDRVSSLAGELHKAHGARASTYDSDGAHPSLRPPEPKGGEDLL